MCAIGAGGWSTLVGAITTALHDTRVYSRPTPKLQPATGSVLGLRV